MLQLKSQIFSTTADNQASVLIKVYEGERGVAKHNNLLGQFELTGIEPASRGVPQIEVSFALDADGILEVTARDKTTGRSEKISMETDCDRLTPEEIERMIVEAEKFAAEDREVRDRAEARNELDRFVFELRSKIEELEGVEAPVLNEERVAVS